MSILHKFGKLDKYSAYDGNLKIDGNLLSLFGETVACNLKDHIAINLRGGNYISQLNCLEGIQFERYGQHLYLNGQPVTDTENWMIVNKLYGDWRYE